MKKLFLIIGAPGSGKTTDAQIIATNNADSIVHFSTGDLLRAEVANKTALGQTIDKYISKGNLVPLDIVIDTIVSVIKKSDKPVILIDGFPRSVEQMEALDKILENETDVELKSVIEVDVSEAVAKERILGRARGSDDNEEVFKNRMKVYIEPIDKIRSFYKDRDLLYVINGERSIEEIVNEMENFIKSKI